MQPSKKTTSRRSRAVAKLSSWLKASKIPHEPQPGGALLVQNRDGGEVLVVVTEGAPVAATALAVDLESIWSRDMGVALQAFHTVTQALGWGSPEPVPARTKPAELTHHDFWMRHTEVAISPNPDPEVFTRYKPIINMRVRRFCYHPNNRRLLWEIGMDEDDIRSLVMTWVVSFECLHKILLSTDFDNEKLLHSYLEQRLAELHGRMYAMARNSGYWHNQVLVCKNCNELCEVAANEQPDQDSQCTACKAIGTLVPEGRYMVRVDLDVNDDSIYNASDLWKTSDHTASDDSSLEDLEDAEGPRERKKIASGLLKTALKKMPKAIAVQKLEDLATSPHVEADVSTAAMEHLERLTRTRKKGRAEDV